MYIYDVTVKSHYKERKLKFLLREYLSAFPVVGLTGPRLAEKSTLVQHELADEYSYVSFDEDKNVALFCDDSEQFIQTFYDQKLKKIYRKIRQRVSCLSR